MPKSNGKLIAITFNKDKRKRKIGKIKKISHIGYTIIIFADFISLKIKLEIIKIQWAIQMLIYKSKIIIIYLTNFSKTLL